MPDTEPYSMGMIEAIVDKPRTLWAVETREAPPTRPYLQPGRPEGRKTGAPLQKYLFPAMACGDHSRHRERSARVGWEEMCA